MIATTSRYVDGDFSIKVNTRCQYGPKYRTFNGSRSMKRIKSEFRAERKRGDRLCI